MENGVNPSVDLSAVKRMAQEALDMGSETRNRSLIAVQYYHKKQLTAEEKAALRRRKQPDIVINRIRPAVNGTLGVLQQGQTDPKAWPRTPQDEDSADVATKTLRFIADYNEFDDIRIEGARDFLIQHAVASILGADDNGRVTIEIIAPEEFLFDPRSRREDFRDARYLGIAKWLYADELIALYPGGKESITAAIDAAPAIPVDAALEDRPTGGQPWIDRRRRRLLVVEMYYREAGVWHRCVFHAGAILEAGKSAYLDGDKKPSCPIVAQSCYVDDENVRYGVVYDMLDLQDEINKRRSKALHLMNTRLVRVGLNYADSPENARREASRPDGVLIGNPDDVDILKQDDMTQGNLLMLQEAKAELERNGPNPAILGRQGEDTSGRAVLARQQAGLVELAIVFAGHESWERRVYKKAWEIAQQYWTAADFIRVTDDEGAPQFVGINQPVMGQAVVGMDPTTGLAMIQPQVLGYDNALAEMSVDITLDSVPDTATLQQEQFAVLAELAKLYGPQEVPFDDMLMLSSISDKSKILERRKARAEQQTQTGAMAQQVAVAKEVSDINNKDADTRLKDAQTEKTIVEAHTSAFQAGFQATQVPEIKGAASR